MKKLQIFLLCFLCTIAVQAQKQYKLASPNGKLQTTITTGKQLSYDITLDGKQILSDSPMAMTLDNGEVWGENDKPVKRADHAMDELRYYLCHLSTQPRKQVEKTFVQKDKERLYRQLQRSSYR